jgi:hypothetical protein
VADEWPCRCPGCGAALLVDSPLNILARWPQILARYGLTTVAMDGGWERSGLEGMVPLDSADAAACDAVYVGDLITPEVACPRCNAPVCGVIGAAARGKGS